MSPEEAYKIIYQVTGAVPLVRSDSDKLKEALAVLAGLLPKKE